MFKSTPSNIMTQSSDDLFKTIEQQEKVAKEFGFYWETIDQLTEQIISECNEIQEAWQKNDPQHLQEEVGDLLLAATSLAIFCKLDPSKALKESTEKFQKRYDKLVENANKDGLNNLKGQSFNVLMHYWNKAKLR